MGLRQVCMMSSWTCNCFICLWMGLQEWKARIINAGVCLNERDGRQCRMSSFLFPDDTVLTADSEECLQRMANEMGSGVWKEKAEGKCE